MKAIQSAGEIPGLKHNNLLKSVKILPPKRIPGRVSKMGIPGSSGMSNITNLGHPDSQVMDSWLISRELCKVCKEVPMWSYSGNMLKMTPIHSIPLDSIPSSDPSIQSSPLCGRSNNPPPKRAKMRHATKVTLKAKLSNSGLPSCHRGCGFQWDQRCLEVLALEPPWNLKG